MSEKKQKNWSTTLVLASLTGGLGIERFYLGKTKTGLLKLITAGGLGVWTLYDIALVLSDKMKDKDGNSLKKEHKDWIITSLLTPIFGFLTFSAFVETSKGGVGLVFFPLVFIFLIFTIWLLYYSVTILKGREDFLEKENKK